MLGVEHLIPRTGIALAQEVDDFIAADTADHPVGIQAMHLGNRRAQGAVVGGGVAVQRVNRARKRLFRLVRRAERVFVRRKFHSIGHSGHMGGSAFVEGDIHDTRLRANFRCHFKLPQGAAPC